MKRQVLLLLIMLPLSLFGQEVVPEHGMNSAVPLQTPKSDLSHPGQVFTPGAASLGVYGKIPVNFNTGSADIQIPLTELRGKTCTQPVYISYRTGGHKIGEVPGPFGLGWTLHAGGCINRIVNGGKDEMSRNEHLFLCYSDPQAYQEFLDTAALSAPGYMYHPHAAQQSDYNYTAFFYPRTYDLAPDEFQICAEGLSGSFYLGQNGVPVYVSKTPDTYTITYETSTIEGPTVLYSGHSWQPEIKVRYFTYISKIMVTDSKGIKYTFGGDMSSIDFSYSPTNTPSISFYHSQQNNTPLGSVSLDVMEHEYMNGMSGFLGDPRIVATANTWYLVSKEYPMTGEIITYSYEKKGFPVHVSDVNTRFIVLTKDATYASWGDHQDWESLSFTDDREQSDSHSLPKTNLSYTILNPSYLKKIESNKTKDSINFAYQDLDGLTFSPDVTDFSQIFCMGNEGFSFLSEENKYYTVTAVSSTRGITYFLYSRDNTGNLVGGVKTAVSSNDNPLSFLSGTHGSFAPVPSSSDPDTPDITPMSSVMFPEENRKYRIHLERVLLCGGTSAAREYVFKYNASRLPEYGSKVSDHWGYYCGKGWGTLLSTKNNSNVVMSDIFCEQTVEEWFNERRSASGVGIAESLESVIYPTGGSTTFVYEPHQYNKVANLYPRRISQASGTAGGFRIKEIIDSTGSQAEVRHYTYHSSGILNGKPKYAAVGYFTSENADPVVEQESYVDWTSGLVMRSKYRYASEGSINQIPTSSGSHIAYSLVTEQLGDGSSITYKYSDWEEYPDIQAETYHSFRAKDLMNPFTSCDIMRGLLEEVTYRNAEGTIVQKEQMEYRDSVCTSEAYGDLTTGLFSYTRRMIYPSDSPWYYSFNRVYHFFPTPAYYYESMPYYIRLSRCFIFGKTPYLISKEITTWDNNGLNPVSVTTTYQYNARNQLIRERTVGSSVTEHHVRWSGDLNLGPYRDMADAGMTGYPVEETEVEDGKVISSVLHEYGLTPCSQYQHVAEYRSVSQEGIPFSFFCPYDGVHKAASYGNVPEETYVYDSDGNVIKTEHRDGTYSTVIWGYNGTYPDMVSSAQEVSSIAYYPFEDEDLALSFEGPLEQGFHSRKSHVGPFSVSLPNVSGVNEWVIDYMVKDILGVWTYRRHEVDSLLSTYTITEGNCPIDNVRVYPKGADVVSYTWFPRVGIRSSTDSAGNAFSYEYDVNGRLKAVFDAADNPVTGYYYNYVRKEE